MTTKRLPNKAILCKTCKGLGSPAPIRAICGVCQGRGVLIVKAEPLTKDQLWKRLTRLAGEAFWSRGPKDISFCQSLSPEATCLHDIRDLIEQLNDDVIHDNNGVRAVPLSKKFARKLQVAFKAWNEAKI